MSTFTFDPSNLVIHIGREIAIVAQRDVTAGIPMDDHRRIFIYRHIKNLSVLLITMPKHRTYIDGFTLRLMARPALESGFCIAAAIADPIFAPSKIVTEQNKWSERMEKMKGARGVC